MSSIYPFILPKDKEAILRKVNGDGSCDVTAIGEGC